MACRPCISRCPTRPPAPGNTRLSHFAVRVLGFASPETPMTTSGNRLIRACSLAIALGATLWGGWAHASDDVTGRLEQILEKRFPTIHITAVQPSPIAGLYQVIAGDQIVYTDPSG